MIERLCKKRKNKMVINVLAQIKHIKSVKRKKQRLFYNIRETSKYRRVSVKYNQKTLEIMTKTEYNKLAHFLNRIKITLGESNV